MHFTLKKLRKEISHVHVCEKRERERRQMMECVSETWTEDLGGGYIVFSTLCLFFQLSDKLEIISKWKKCLMKKNATVSDDRGSASRETFY